MSESTKTPPSASGHFALVTLILSHVWAYPAMGLAILLLDLVTGPYLLFPIFFVIPVALAAWFYSPRLAYALGFLLPVGRLFIAMNVDVTSPFPYMIVNALIRVGLLLFIAFLVSRTARLTKELERRYDDIVTLCAWSNTVEYQGEWISFEQYLLRRFNINTSHGMSPAEFQKAFEALRNNEHVAS
jgi:hypothetical protein